MTPPIGSTPPARPVVAVDPGEGISARPAQPPLFRPQPLLQFRPEFRNPFRYTGSIETFGDLEKAVRLGFIEPTLGDAADLYLKLGSFPGGLHPEGRIPEEWYEEANGKRVLRHWAPDQKPDRYVVGNAAEMLQRMAPSMGWNSSTLEANIRRSRAGLLIFNQAVETRAGPLPVKMGIIDREVLFGGETYISMRDWLLPVERGHEFLKNDPEFRARFLEWNRVNKADYFRRVIGNVLFRRHLSAEDIVQLSFQLQFRNYEAYRIFDWFKGPAQADRMRSILPEIFVPAIQQYLRANRDLKVYHPSRLGVALPPNDITPEMFPDLEFVLDRSFGRRLASWFGVGWEIFIRNFRNARQTFRNISSNGTRRRGYQDPTWFDYGLRKFQRFVGINGETVPRAYRPEASNFASDAERLGRTSTPLNQMVILAGYDPGNEEVESVYREIVRYAETELRKGANVNPLLKGIEPSKFVIPVRGVPSLAYQMMNWLESEGIQHLRLVGTEDVQKIYERFVEFYGADIEARGKTHQFIPMGPSFTANLKRGLEAVPNKGENVIVGFGDNPLIDMERIAHHPHRHVVDWIVAVNSSTRLMHDGGKNYHIDGQHDGVHDPAKEGNAFTYPGDVNRVPWNLLQALFDSRKSMADAGGRGKLSIIMEALYGPVGGRYFDFLSFLSRRIPIRGVKLLPYLGFLPVLLPPTDSNIFLWDFARRAVWNQVQRRVLHRKVPPYALDLELSERLLKRRLNWGASLFPNHSDAGGVLDVDGVFDLAIAKGLMEGTDHPERIYPHWEKLAPFVNFLLERSEEFPTLRGTPERINRLYERLRNTFLEKGYSVDQLRSHGFSQDAPPMLSDGTMNPAFMELVLPEREFRFYRLGFEAYQRRGVHAKGLIQDFQQMVEATQAPGEPLDAKSESLIWTTLNYGPERYRSLLIEWNFEHVNSVLLDAVSEKFGAGSPEMARLENYLQASTADHADTPLRRFYLGLKAVDVLRRYMDNVSPEEFRTLYPTLVEALHDARGAVPPSYSYLGSFFSHAQTTVDREYVSKVGESPPQYRTRGLLHLYRSTHSNSREPVRSNRSSSVRRVDSAAFLPQEIADLANRLKILPSRIPHLIAAASGANSQDRLHRIVEQRMTPERLLAWAQTEDGRLHLEGRGNSFQDNFRNRLREGGPGLAFGIASLLGAEKLADVIGLDAKGHPQERFMFVVALSHVANVGASSVNEVWINRSLAQPFNFATTRTVSAGSEAALQYTFEARTSFGRAVLASLAKNFHLEGGLGRVAWNGLKGTVTLPFRTGWNMGPGLMSAAIVDRLIGERFLSDSPRARQWVHFGSFFLPDVYRIAIGNRGPLLLNNRLMRGASRAFAAGFIADMLFLGANRVNHGAEGSAALNSIYARANQLRDQHRSWWSRPIDGAFEMIAPALSAYWDSVEFHGLDLVPNHFQREAREELVGFSQTTTNYGREVLRHSMIFGNGEEATSPEFYRSIDYGFLRGENTLANLTTADGRTLPVEDVQQQLSDPAIYQRVMVQMNPDQRIEYIQRQFRGYALSRTDVKTILGRMTLHRLRSDIAQFENFQLPENQELRQLFDARGALREGRETHLAQFIFGGQAPSSDEILGMRRLGLAVRILRLREESPESGELASFERTARQTGLLDAQGRFTDAETESQARAQLTQAEGSTAASSFAPRRREPEIRIGGLPASHFARRWTRT